MPCKQRKTVCTALQSPSLAFGRYLPCLPGFTISGLSTQAHGELNYSSPVHIADMQSLLSDLNDVPANTRPPYVLNGFTLRDTPPDQPPEQTEPCDLIRIEMKADDRYTNGRPWEVVRDLQGRTWTRYVPGHRDTPDTRGTTQYKSIPDDLCVAPQCPQVKAIKIPLTRRPRRSGLRPFVVSKWPEEGPSRWIVLHPQSHPRTIEAAEGHHWHDLLYPYRYTPQPPSHLAAHDFRRLAHTIGNWPVPTTDFGVNDYIQLHQSPRWDGSSRPWEVVQHATEYFVRGAHLDRWYRAARDVDCAQAGGASCFTARYILLRRNGTAEYCRHLGTNQVQRETYSAIPYADQPARMLLDAGRGRHWHPLAS